MLTSVLQALALVIHGNVFLAGKLIHGFYPDHPVFLTDESVRFVDLEREGEGWKLFPYSEDPLSWFQRLKLEGCRGLRVQWMGSGEGLERDRITTAFVGGGGRWFLEAVFEEGSDLWEGRSDNGEGGRLDQRMWRVTYGRIANKWTKAFKPVLSPEEVVSSFATVLRQASAYARAQNFGGFANSFDRALAFLEADDLPAPLDLGPAGQLPLEARRLLAAAQTAWVFGGMGSWNDLVGDAVYDRISEKLFEAVISAAVTGANQSFEKSVPGPEL